MDIYADMAGMGNSTGNDWIWISGLFAFVQISAGFPKGNKT